MINRKAPSGSIVGFDIQLDPTGTVNEVTPSPHFSATKMIEKFRRILRDLDPKKLEELSNKIDDHILKSGNVHSMRFSDLGADVIEQITTLFFPGTPPLMIPTFALDPTICEWITDEIYQMSSYPTGYKIFNEEGVMVNGPTSGIIIDYGVDGTPMIPLFGKRSNRFSRSNAKAAFETIATTTSRLRTYGEGVITVDTEGLLGPDLEPDNTVLVKESNGTTGTQGCICHVLNALTSTATTLQTPSVYVFPYLAEYITLQLVNVNTSEILPNHLVTVDVVNKKVYFKGTEVLDTYIHMSRSGWLRIGLSAFVSSMSGDISLSVLGHHDPEVFEYEGSQKTLFGLFGISHNLGAGLPPYIPTSNATGLVTFPDLEISMDASTIRHDEGMIYLRWYSHLAHGSTPFSDESHDANLFEVDGQKWITIESESDTLICMRSGYQISTPLTESLENVITALSYSPLSLKHKTTGNPSVTLEGEFSSIATEAPLIKIGPLQGYLKELAIYPVSDNNLSCEFFVGT
jgi:hypothetical protein